MTDLEEMLVFIVEEKAYEVDMSILARLSSLPLGFWLDELIDPTQHGITQPEVDAFLAAATGRSFHAAYTGNLTRLTDWYAVLRLSTRWSFPTLRNRAIVCLTTLVPPIERLFLARAYDVPQWLVPAYAALALRDDPLSEAELRRLHPQDIFRITTTREAIYREQLSDDEAGVTSHITCLLRESSVNPGDSRPTAEISTQPPVPSLFSIAENLAIVVPARAPTPMTSQIYSKEDCREDAPLAEVDVSLFTMERFDEAMELVTPDTIDRIVCTLFTTPEFLSGTLAPKFYSDRAILIAQAALRRGMRDATFLHVGPRFVKSILQIPDNAEQGFSMSLQSLNARFRQFVRSRDIVPRQDNAGIMPTGLTPSVYRTYMEHCQAFVAALAEQGVMYNCRWLTNSYILPSTSTP